MKKSILIIILFFYIVSFGQTIPHIGFDDLAMCYWDNINEIPIHIKTNEVTVFQYLPDYVFSVSQGLIYPIWFSVQIPEEYVNLTTGEYVRYDKLHFKGIWLCDSSTKYVYIEEFPYIDKSLFEISKEEALDLYHQDGSNTLQKVTNLDIYMKYVRYELQNKAYTQSYCAYVANMKFIFYNFDKQDAQKILDSFTIYRWPYKIKR